MGVVDVVTRVYHVMCGMWIFFLLPFAFIREWKLSKWKKKNERKRKKEESEVIYIKKKSRKQR